MSNNLELVVGQFVLAVVEVPSVLWYQAEGWCVWTSPRRLETPGKALVVRSNGPEVVLEVEEAFAPFIQEHRRVKSVHLVSRHQTIKLHRDPVVAPHPACKVVISLARR